MLNQFIVFGYDKHRAYLLYVRRENGYDKLTIGGYMKKIVLLAAVTLHLSVFAAPREKVRVLKDTTTLIALKLTEETVFCTDRGYGNVQLKVSVPDLDWLAHFDHRVFGEGVPCMTGGACKSDFTEDGKTPADLIKSDETVDIVPMRVILSERIELDKENKTCQRQIIEEIQSTVRGHEFNHYRDGEMKAEDFETCYREFQL